MNGALPAARLTGFEHLIAEMDNDPKDRHVAAAHAEATGILTYNLRDFRGAEILKRCIRIITPAVFVEELISEAPDTIAQAILKMSRRRLRPPMTPDEIATSIARQQDFGGLRDRLLDLVQ